MLVIRHVREEDLDGLVELARLTTFGLTTLPRDRKLLEKRIRSSLRAFAAMEGEAPRGDAWLFVMEDLDRRTIVGTSGIVSKVGGFEPFYAYRIETTVHESKMLGVRKEIRALHLVREHDGPCEIGSLFLHPDWRRAGNGRVLSLARFLFIAAHPSFIDPTVIAEMRGVIDERGRSPFWDALGRHFFDLEFPKADYLSIVNKEFIGDLMPTHPIYVPLLPPEAQRVIGEVHEDTRPALRLLESEGFTFSGMVDIFEAGPILRADRDGIRSVRESRRARVATFGDGAGASPDFLVSNERIDFRACASALEWIDEGSVCLPRATASALEVREGDPIRFVPLRPRRETS